MERLTGFDAGYLYMETPTLHMHTLKLALLDMSAVAGGYDFERFERELERRLHLLPPFRRRFVKVPFELHHPVWIEDPDFDLAHHVRRAAVPAPGGSREMDALIGDIAGRQLDRTRPLWEIWMLDGLADGRVAFLAKIHHTLADGLAAAQLLANVMAVSADDVDPPPPLEAWAPEEVPSRWRLVAGAIADMVRKLGRLPRLVRSTGRGARAVAHHRKRAGVRPPRPIVDVPNTPFNASLTPHRTFATATVPLARVKAVKAAFDVSVNDVVLAMVAGSLRAYLDARRSLPDRALVAGVPVSTDEPGAEPRLGGNKVSNLFTSLRTDLGDPVARLQAIHEVTRAAKHVHNLLGADMLADWAEYTPPKPYAWFMRLYSRWRLADRHRPPINLVVSNVPGPRDPLYVAGARLDRIYSVGPILEGIGLNVTVWSYLDQLNIGAIACREHVGDLHEVTDGMAVALDELLALAEERGTIPAVT